MNNFLITFLLVDLIRGAEMLTGVAAKMGRRISTNWNTHLLPYIGLNVSASVLLERARYVPLNKWRDRKTTLVSKQVRIAVVCFC